MATLDDKALKGQQLKTYTSYVKAALNTKQGTLTSGANITIDGATISSLDEKVKQNPLTGGRHPLLLMSRDTTSITPLEAVTEGSGFDGDISFEPQSNTLHIGAATLTPTQYSGKSATAGTADTATTIATNPSITIGAGTSSSAPTVNVTVGGKSGTAQALPIAGTNAYGVVKVDASLSDTSQNPVENRVIADKVADLEDAISDIHLDGDTVTVDVDGANLDIHSGDTLNDVVEVIDDALGDKQDTLVSGSNIRTVDNQSLLGDGNINSKRVDQSPVDDNKPYPLLLAGFDTASTTPIITVNYPANFDAAARLNPSTDVLTVGTSSKGGIEVRQVTLLDSTNGTLTATQYSGNAATATNATNATNDGNGLNIATNYALKSEVLLPTPIIVTTLPATVPDAHKGKFIFIRDNGASTDTRNVYTEYIAVQEDGTWKYERIGTTEVNVDVDYLTNDDIASIWNSTAAAS